MKTSSIALMLALALAGCGKSAKTTDGAGSGATAATGSDTSMMAAGSGSGSGSGSMMATGSGSDAGSGSGSAMAAGSGSGSDAGSGSGSAVAWKDDPTNYPHHGDKFDALEGEARGKFMKEHVTPAMKTEFQKFDGKKYADFGCKTCHGKDAREVHFHMPNPNLPKLDFDALKAGKQKPEIAKWMGEVIEPGMAKILGAQPYDPATNQGFGCLDCHEQKK